MKSMIASLIVCMAWCLATAAEAAEQPKITFDVAYGHKDSLQTFDVVTPPHAQWGGNPVHVQRQLGFDQATAGSYLGGRSCIPILRLVRMPDRSLIRVSPSSSCGIAAAKTIISCPRSSMTCAAAFVLFDLTPSGSGSIPSGWASSAPVRAGTWR